MKKSLTILLSLSVCALVLFGAAFRAAASTQYIFDEPDYIGDDYEAELDRRIAQLSEKTGWYIAVEFCELFASSEEQMQNHTDDFIIEHAPNYSADTPAAVLSVDMGERYYHISTHGSAIYTLGRNISNMKSTVQSALKAGDYEGAVRGFLSDIEFYYDIEQEQGSIEAPVENPETAPDFKQNFIQNFNKSIWAVILIALAVPLLVCFSVWLSYRRNGKATGYEQSKNTRMHMKKSENILLDKRVSVTRIHRDNDSSGSSGGGGSISTHSGSDGSSFGGGGGRF